MRIAPEGKSILTWAGSLTIISGFLTIFIEADFLLIILAISVFSLCFSLYFFRDPQRTIPAGEGIIVAPADGKVVRIDQIDDPDVGQQATRISIFLSVFNVHVNRMPLPGEFRQVDYRPGKFLAAFNHKASEVNEQTDILIASGNENFRLKQIAGVLARRILCYARIADTMETGGRLGFIRFGSRTDLVLPASAKLQLEVGQKVTGGVTVIGEYQ